MAARVFHPSVGCDVSFKWSRRSRVEISRTCRERTKALNRGTTTASLSSLRRILCVRLRQPQPDRIWQARDTFLPNSFPYRYPLVEAWRRPVAYYFATLASARVIHEDPETAVRVLENRADADESSTPSWKRSPHGHLNTAGQSPHVSRLTTIFEPPSCSHCLTPRTSKIRENKAIARGHSVVPRESGIGNRAPNYSASLRLPA
jgi:hypothetical protein